MKDSAGDPVVVEKFWNPIVAQVYRSKLKAHGIQAQVVEADFEVMCFLVLELTGRGL